MRVLFIALITIVAAGSCRGREGQQVAGAVESFIEFSMSNEERPKSPREAPQRPHLHERSRKTNLEARGGSILVVEIDLPHDLDSKAVVDSLTIELDRLVGEANYAQVKLTGHPAGLLGQGGVMGTASARRGRDGKVATKVVSRVRDDQPTLTDTQYKVLVDLELAIARAPSGREAAARAEMGDRYGVKVVGEAVRVAKRRYGTSR